MPNLENLKKRKPFVKGDKRINKAGRPKLPDLTELMGLVLGEDKDGITAAQAILMALRVKATKGDVRAAELILNRAYGKPKESIEHSGEVKTTTTIIWGEGKEINI